MNELRMYVERLFEGRVLTSETIELKEEIYGNLVARYEDYVASGMSEAEALEKTKASMTSVDDVLKAEDAEGASDVPSASAAVSEPEPSSVAASATAPDAAPVTEAPTTVMPQASVAGSSVDPAFTPAPRKKWPFVVAGIAAAMVLLGILGIVLFNVLPGRGAVVNTTAQTQGVQEDGAVADNAGTSAGVQGGTGAQDGTGAQSGNGAQNGNGAQGGSGAGQTSTPSYVDPEDQAEYEATVALDNAVSTHTAASLSQAAAAGTGAAQLVETLPLAEYLASATADAGQTTLEVRYQNVSDLIDGDAAERALLYDAAALMSACPSLQTVTVTVHEQYDSDYDVEVYDFTRTMLEHGFSNASGGAIAQLDRTLLESADTWEQVRGYVFRENFRDRQIDYAERD